MKLIPQTIFAKARSMSDPSAMPASFHVIDEHGIKHARVFLKRYDHPRWCFQLVRNGARSDELIGDFASPLSAADAAIQIHL